MNKRNLTLISRIEKELSELKKVVSRAIEAWQRAMRNHDDYYLDAVALNLQSFYTGFERIFTTIASQIDESVPTGSEWHKELLKQMATEIKLTRKPVLSQNLFLQLDEYRAFRQIVQNLYAFNFSESKLERLVLTLPATFANIEQEIGAFLAAIEL